MRNPNEQLPLQLRMGEEGRTRGEEGPRVPVEENCALTFAKRFTAELCFAGIFVLGLIEAVVKAIFAIPAFFITLCTGTEPGSFGEFLQATTWLGAQLSFAIALNALAGLVTNIYQQKIDQHNLPLRDAMNECLFYGL